MTEPILTDFLVNAAGELAAGVIMALTRKARAQFESPPYRQALVRCYQAAAAALLPADKAAQAQIRPILQTFFRQPEAQKELAALVRGREMDRERLADLFEEATEGQAPPDYDFETKLAEFSEAFLQAAAQEEVLVNHIQIDFAREANKSLLSLAADLAAIRRAVEQARPGGVAAHLQIDIQTAPAAKDPCPDLARKYLQALQAEAVRLPLASLEDEGARRHSTAVTLEQVYIALNTTGRVSLSDEEKKVADLLDRSGERPLTALEAARQHRRLVLLGDPGGGKSVFVNHLAYLLAGAHLFPETAKLDWPEPRPWPRRIILRDLAADLAAHLDLPALAAWAEDRQGRTLRRAFETHVQNQFSLSFGLTETEAAAWAACLSGRPLLTIFDGLDEVGPDQLEAVSQLILAIEAHQPGSIIVTCRIRSYQGMTPLPGFRVEILAQFEPDQIDRFIDHWYQAQRQIAPAEKSGRIANLKKAVRSDKLAELAPNPLLLTTMSLVHTAETELPKERAKLYQRSVDVLMRRWQTHKFGQQTLLNELGVDTALLLRGLWRLAYEAHGVVEPGQQADVDGDKAAGILARACFNNDKNRADRFLEYVDRQAGLLVGRGGSKSEPRLYSFVHRTFQEYLAGCYLALGGEEKLAELLVGKLNQGEHWYLAGQLAAEHLLYNVGLDRDVYELLRRLCPQARPRAAPDWRGVTWAGVIAAEMGQARLCADSHPDGGRQLLKRLQERLGTIVDRGRLTVAERAEAGQALAVLGDPRSGVGLTKDGLPDILWRPVEAGAFTMGTDDGDEEEKPAHPVTLAAYEISQYPITNVQFGAFVADEGYQQEAYWPEAIAAGYWQEGKFKGLVDDEPRARSYDFGVPFNLANHPVVGVSWYEAVAFCRWLSEKMGYPFACRPRPSGRRRRVGLMGVNIRGATRRRRRNDVIWGRQGLGRPAPLACSPMGSALMASLI